MKMNPLGWIAWILVIIGGLNWGLVGIFQFDLVATLFGDASVVSRIVYTLVGIAAVVMIFVPCMCKQGESSSTGSPQA